MQCKPLFIFSLVILLAAASSAQPAVNSSGSNILQASGSNTYAIVVGISGYRYIRPLNYADKDAELFADLLRSPAGGSVKEENLFLLLNDSANAGNFWSAFSRISNKDLKEGDRVYIYFAGHGDGVKGLNEYYLLLEDCQPANDGNNYLLSFGAIDMYRLKNRIGLLTGRKVEVILVLDACRTNELAGGYASQVFTSSVMQTKVGEIAMLATGPGQVSIEDVSFGKGHGLFTYNLVDGLSGQADKEDGDNNNAVSLDETNRWVSKRVKKMSEKFNVKQEPVFCCDDKKATIISRADSAFSTAWEQVKENNNSGVVSFVRTQRGAGLAADTGLLNLYNKFNAARSANRLWGDSSANSYYDLMEGRFQKEQITEDARYTLAADFINFAQQKINLYLEGKDVLSVEMLQEKTDSAATPGFLSDEYERMKKAVSEKWTITGKMVEKAGKLLSAKNDSTLLYQLKPKIRFLLARGYISGEKETDLSFEKALQYSLDAFNADSTAAYTAECLGLIHAWRYSLNRGLGITEYELGTHPRKKDSAMLFFKKAISLAPKWASPYRSIGLKIFGNMRSDSALNYLYRALLLNPADGTTYMMIGNLHRNVRHDSAMYYYRKALSLSGTSSHAMIYRKMAREFLHIGYVRNSPLFIPDSVMYYSKLALASDPELANNPSGNAEVFRDVYMDIASTYAELQKNDSAVLFYKKTISLFPGHEWANRSLIGIFARRNLPDSVLYHAHKFLLASPENPFALLEIAKYYENRKGFTDSAILYYQRNLAVTKEKDMPREKLGYMLMIRSKNDTRPLEYFTETMKEFPAGWRAYYNIACYYANIQNEDKAIEFLEKSFQKGMKIKKQLYADPFLASLREGQAFKNLVIKYLPD